MTTAVAEEIRALRRRNAELEQTIEILEVATSLCAGERPAHPPLNKWSVESSREQGRFGVVGEHATDGVVLDHQQLRRGGELIEVCAPKQGLVYSSHELRADHPRCPR